MRQKLPKILTAIFIIIFIFQLIGLIVLFATPQPIGAQEPKLQVPITGFSGFKPAQESNGTLTIDWIGEYINAIYKYAIGIVGILAAVVLMIGGVIWITAGGNQTRVGEAKAWIGASLTGLVLALGSFLILQTVNPKLVEIKPISVKIPNEAKAGCCEKIGSDGKKIAVFSNSNSCKGKNETFKEGWSTNTEGTACIKKAEQGQICSSNSDCKDGLVCVVIDPYTNKTVCSDGKVGSPCDGPEDCLLIFGECPLGASDNSPRICVNSTCACIAGD